MLNLFVRLRGAIGAEIVMFRTCKEQRSAPVINTRPPLLSARLPTLGGLRADFSDADADVHSPSLSRAILRW